MTEKRLRPTKTISTKTLSSLSEKMCEKIKDAAYANIVNAVKNDKQSAIVAKRFLKVRFFMKNALCLVYGIILNN